MKCPHCGKESKAKVVESRRVNGQVWRQRICGLCLTSFVSTEITSADLKFPWNDLKNKRQKLTKPKKSRMDFSVTSAWSNNEQGK